MEAFTNVVVGYGLAVTMQHALFPLFALYASLADNMRMAAVFTVVSIVRSCSLRWVFEAIRIRQSRMDTAGR